MRRRVIKVGGSLLQFEDLRASFLRWLALQPAAANVLIVGGGPLVEAIRDLDRRLGLGEEAAHWLSIRAMGISARVAAELWPEFELVTAWDVLREAMIGPQTPIVFDVEEFLRLQESYALEAVLPQSWSVTSDSIAARVAETLAADELVLLKSSLPEHSPISLSAAAALGYVDVSFPRAARALPHVRAVNLRSRKYVSVEFV